MFCGTGSFKTLDDDQCKSPSTPKGNKRKSTSKNNNPFSSRGLDKFSTVVSELKSRKEKIIAETGSEEDVVMVRFMHSRTKEWVPIIIRLPDSKQHIENVPKRKKQLRSIQSLPVSPREYPNIETKEESSGIEEVTKDENIVKKRGFFESLSRMRPCTYWPWAMVIVLISLVFFGRTFAICCTSIWWYVIPILNGEEELSHEKRLKKKKDFKRKISSDKNLGNKIGGDNLDEPASSPRDDLASSKKGRTKRMCSF